MERIDQSTADDLQNSDPQMVVKTEAAVKKAILPNLFNLSIIAFLIITVFTVIFSKYRPNPSNNNKKEVADNPASPSIKYEQWVNCTDIRDVIEEGEKLYLSCLGGVLIINNDGKVLDQISMSDGLSDSTTTSLAKYQDLLFIGTQDGFTKFDLNSRKAEKIGVQEGLVNGANIQLAVDGDILWVGTFNGISKYDIKKGMLENTKASDVGSGQNLSVQDMAVTLNKVFFEVVANAYSGGGILEYSKDNGQWKLYGADKFGEDHRVDFNDVYSTGSILYAVVSNNDVWVNDTSSDGGNWKKLVVYQKILDALNEDYVNLRIAGADGGNLYILAEGTIFKYDGSDGSTERVYDTGIKDRYIVSVRSVNKKFWVSSLNDNWLGFIDFNNFSYTNIPKPDRPLNVTKILSVINEDPYILDESGLWRYRSVGNIFDKTIKLELTSDLSNPVFLPIPTTSNILIYGQECGMECSEPVIKILNYASGGVKDLQLPDAVLMTLTGDGSAGGGVGALEFEGVDSVMETVYFSYSKGKTKQYVSLNLKSIKWELKEDLPENDLFEDIRLMSKLCNYNYTHSQSTGFNKISCREETLPGDGFKYYLSEGKFIKESVDDNSRTILQPVLMTQKYSPFGWTEEGVVRELVYDGGSFWLGTNLGISGYNPKEETWKLIGTDEGLVSREVSGFVVSEDKIWVTTRWGGLSRININ